jgi:AraC-like DNA-binding protein
MTVRLKDMTAGNERAAGARQATASAMVVTSLLDFAVARGAERESLARQSRIDLAELRDPDSRVPFARYVSLMRAAQRQCDDPALALHFGEFVDASDVSIAHAMGGASGMSEAMTLGNRYAPLAVEVETDGEDRFQLQRDRGELWFVDTRRNPNEFPELTESAFARMACTMRKMLNGGQAYTAVHVTHARPDHHAEYERIFQAPVVFSSDRNALRLDAALIASFQMPKAPEYTRRVLKDHADALLEKLESTGSIRRRVEELLTPMLQSGEVGIDAVAAQLCCSRQTLFRKLQAEGVTFEQTLDDLRHRLATDYLDARKTSVKETARLIGYSDAAAFSRAFKRWTGRSPREYARNAAIAIVLMFAGAAVACIPGAERPADSHASGAVGATAADSIAVRGAEERGEVNDSAFRLPPESEALHFARSGKGWVTVDSSAPDLSVWSRDRSATPVAVRFTPPHADGEYPPQWRYFFGDTTRVEVSWSDGQNGCAESALVVLRWEIVGESVVRSGRRVFNQDRYEVSSCALGQGDRFSVSSSWPVLKRILEFQYP